MQVAEILAKKGRATFTVTPDDTVTALSALLRAKRIGAAVVSRDGQAIDGVVSERDIAYKVSLHEAKFADLPVSSIMTTPVITCRLTDDVAAVASTMLARNIRHLPVADEHGKLLGMVSMRDVLNLRIDELQQETALLRAFNNEGLREPQDRD